MRTLSIVAPCTNLWYCQLKANSDQSTGGAGSLISDKSMDFGQVNYLFSG